MPPGQTTLPADDTSSADPSRGLAIRWLFPSFTGTTTRLEGRIVLGRDEPCDVCLPGTETSRQHADIRIDGPIAIVRDLGSRNGVFLNGALVTEAPIEVGDVLRFGNYIGVVTRIPDEPEQTPVFGALAPGLFGGPVLRPALARARQAATSDLPIILEGDTGTGKEGTARAIHEWSGRNGPFLALNCAALPEALAEAELFGYRRGAFTGAEHGAPGLFRAADRGTILLDEIIDLPLTLQAKLLRVIEQKEVQPLGLASPVPIDVRIIAACQRPLQHAVDEKKFRADLFARLDGVTVGLPPLRARTEEIPFLMVQLLHKHSGGTAPPVEAKLVEQMCLYDWPFNVREVDLLMRRLLVLHGAEPLLRRSHLPERFRAIKPRSRASQQAIVVDPAVERQHKDERDFAALTASLPVHDGNLARAAAAAGISRARAYRLIEAHPDVEWDVLRKGGG